MFCVVRLSITPIPGPPLRVRHGNDMDSILAVAEDNLKWESLHTARAMPAVDPNEAFRIGLDVGERKVNRHAEIASCCGTLFRIPLRRFC